MQVDYRDGLTKEKREELSKKLGFEDNPVPFDKEKMEKAIKHPDVQQVRVFRLERGMKINIEGQVYKVIAVRQNGKVTLKPVQWRSYA